MTFMDVLPDLASRNGREVSLFKLVQSVVQKSISMVRADNCLDASRPARTSSSVRLKCCLSIEGHRPNTHYLGTNEVERAGDHASQRLTHQMRLKLRGQVGLLRLPYLWILGTNKNAANPSDMISLRF